MKRREVFMLEDPDRFVQFHQQRVEAADNLGAIDRYKTNLYLAVAMYSRGDSLEDVRAQFQLAARALELNPEEETEHFRMMATEDYYSALWGLSMAIVFGDATPVFQHRAGGQDALFDRLLKLTGALIIPSHSILHPKPFADLVQAIDHPEGASKAINTFLKNWYDGLKHSRWHDKHLKQDPSFFGYWAFEVAAAVKLLNLDDDLFADNIFYPRDLVHQRIFRTWMDTGEGEDDRNIRTAHKAKRNIGEISELLKGFFEGNAKGSGKEVEGKVKETMNLLSILMGAGQDDLAKRPELFRQSLLTLMQSVLKVSKTALENTTEGKEGSPKVQAAFKQIEEQLKQLQPNLGDLEKSLGADDSKRPDSAKVVEEARSRISDLNESLRELVESDTVSLENMLSGLEQLAATHAERFGIQQQKPHNVQEEVSGQVKKSLDEARKGKAMDENFDWSSLWKKD